MDTPARLRVATYNIHKCRGFDGKTLPSRIIDVIRELEADLLCLQEVVNAPGVRPIYDQAHEISKAFPEYEWSFGANRPLRGGTYGNMTLARRPILGSRNHNLSRQGREERGALQTDIALNSGEVLHVFNVHLGTGHMERRYQARLLMSEAVLGQTDLTGPRLILGDFNEWTRGLTTRLLRNSFQTFRPEHGLRYPRTYPGMLPLLSLDHCYYEPPLELEATRLWRSPRALIASDHLPLLADFRLSAEAGPKAESFARKHGRHARL
ncbi:MAG TPA: endonuclease/exonuclease/phosphatase family protein [Silvibacterium sp.]|nr:endonuclease/exonuclease/phosphatase family protein [Silvibacterium sp.]